MYLYFSPSHDESSEQHTRHVIVRLFVNLSTDAENPYFMNFDNFPIASTFNF